jgi:hypothetical protein
MSGTDLEQPSVSQLLAAAGLSPGDDDLHAVTTLYRHFGGQRARLAGAPRSETEPLIIPGFDRATHGKEAAGERSER